MRPHPASGDCERLRPGLLAQPVNAASCLAFLGAAGWLWRRLQRLGQPVPPEAALYCAMVAGNGLGGVAFHGPGDRASHWLHDTALVGTLVAVAASSAPNAAAITGAAAVGLALKPDATNAASVVGTALAIGSEVRRGRRLHPRTGMLLAAAGTINALSRTGGRCCRPASRWQGHALWHVLVAIALADWGAQAWAPPPPPPPPPPPNSRRDRWS